MQVDQYDWGCVCHATNGDGDHATWIEHGNVSDVFKLLPIWARDIRSRVRPRCLGAHQPDHVCDGGQGPDGYEPMCAWRERCLYVQFSAAVEDRAPLDVAGEMTDEAMLLGAAHRIEQDALPRQREYEGVPYPTHRPSLTSTQQAAGKARQKKVRKLPRANPRRTAKLSEQAKTSHELAMRFIEMVALRGGWPIATNKYRATPGQLLFTDRSAVSKYINVYYKQDHTTKNNKIVFAVWVRQLGHQTMINVQIHSNETEAIQAMLPGFDTAHWVDSGRKCTAIKGVTEDQISAVSGVVVHAMNSGWINNVAV